MKKLLVALLFIPAIARAEFYTGNDLYSKMMDSSTSVGQAISMGFVVGVYDVGAHIYFCPPRPESGITVGQIHDMSKNWLANNPSRRNELAYSLVTEVFKKAWPCANRNNPTGRGA